MASLIRSILRPAPPMASLFRWILRLFVAEAPQQPMRALTDDLLQEIFLRIGSPADLVRASAACLAFRRLIIADRSFLRRYRSIHPPLLGLVFDKRRTPARFEFAPVQTGHSNAPADRALARAASFSFDEYLPRGRWNHWEIWDVRDGLVLLICRPQMHEGFVFPDHAVCEPLTRRYVLPPPIPDDLLASVQVRDQNIHHFEAYLVPAVDEEASFRVIGMAGWVTKQVVFVFSSGTGRWSIGKSTSWDALSFNLPLENLELGWHHWAYGCFYWKVEPTNKLLRLDMNIMQFSTVDLPADLDQWRIAIAEAGEGKLAMFRQNDEDTSVDYYVLLQNDTDKVHEWQMKNAIPLPTDYQCCIFGQGERSILLVGIPKVQGRTCTVFFSLEIKTLNIERICRIGYPTPPPCVYQYFGFPPSMSPTKIQEYEVCKLASKRGEL